MSKRDEKMRRRYDDLPNMTREDWCEKHDLPLSSWYVYMDKAGLRKQTRKQVRDEKMRRRYDDLPNMTREDWCEKHDLPLSSWYVYMDQAGLRKQTRKQVRGVRTAQKTTHWNITVENDVYQWVIENIPKGKRSAFVNDMMKAHISNTNDESE